MTRVALVQIASPDEETPDERIARVEGLLRQQSQVDLFVLPEIWSAGYFSFDQYEERAETLDGPTVSMCRRVARELGSAIHLGSIVERDTSGKLRNTTVLIDKSGRIAQVYRKIHVFGYKSLESQLLTPGETLSVVDSPVGQLGSITCYDLRFPGLWQELSVRGAEAVAIPAAWPATRRAHWRLLTQARAVEHQVFIIAVNSCGVQHGVELGGYSRVIDPTGAVLAECGAEEEIRIVDIDPARVIEVRDEFPVLADRLNDYTSISDESGAQS
ncbi:MAG: carbon-nitrogen family hydrolase [Actinobacteria bacterium]|nr:carbon-nitrogen family hydrolase [Actinomycetota bacterium]